MNQSLILGWALGIFLSAGILLKLPVNETALTIDAVKRLYPDTLSSITSTAQAHCREIESQNQTPLEKEWVENLRLANSTASERCYLKVSEAKEERFRLSVTKALHLTLIQEKLNSPVYDSPFLISYLLPLSLLPYAIFLLALIFDIPFYPPFFAFLSLLFFYSTLNPISFFASLPASFSSLMLSDKNLLGVCLIFFWTRLWQAGASQKLSPVKPKDTLLSKGILLAFGVWNPSLFVICRKVFSQITSRFQAKSHVLSLQAIALILSVPLMDLTLSANPSFQGLLIPRYFSLTFLFCFLLEEGFATEKQTWTLPFTLLHLLFVLIGETIFYFFIPGTPLILRLSLELLCTELFRQRKLKLSRGNLTFWLSGTAILLMSAFITQMTVNLGGLDLLYRSFSLNEIESGLPLLLFLFAMLTGIVMGNFAVPYFFTLSALSKLTGFPEARAALSDGLIIGILFSPFSLFNWFSAKDLRLSYLKLFSWRWETLKPSLYISLILYFVSGLGSVRVLQPVTFLFLLLAYVVLKLRQRKWKWAMV